MSGPLRIRDFRLLLGARAISYVGTLHAVREVGFADGTDAVAVPAQ